MDHYINIRILPCPELSTNILMSEVFSQLHAALVAVGQGEIGVSFPNVGKTLGDLLRLHGPQSSLQRLMNMPWIGGIKDHLTVSGITSIPKEVSYRVVRRVQPKNSGDRLIRRSVRKGWLTQEEATLKMSTRPEEVLSLPYIRIRSRSTGQRFLLFVEHGPSLTAPVAGSYTTYGLSAGATIPWF